MLVPGILTLDEPPPVLSQLSALLIGPFKQAEEALGDCARFGVDHHGSLGIRQLRKVAGRRDQARSRAGPCLEDRQAEARALGGQDECVCCRPNLTSTFAPHVANVGHTLR